MPPKNIIDVSESNFQYEVLGFSNQTPVVVDFWAEWCKPCHILTPILEKLAVEADGKFRLAKVNTDENPNLTMQFNIRSLPTVKIFHRGQVVSEFSGAKPEVDVRDFLRKLGPVSGNLDLDKGHSLLGLQNWEGAAESFRKALNHNPDDAGALLGLAKSLIAQDKAVDALPILHAFPASKEYSTAEQLIPLAKIIVDLQRGQAALEDEDEFSATLNRAVQLVSMGNLHAAADGLLEILREDKNYLEGQVKEFILAVIAMLGPENPDARKYRDELSSILF